ncbi:mismatch-specific DNA-glycosylase [uncultured Parvibaculum sp.]|uniref:mismatch-specific DNA-glycosylase n=2 Tax=Parvibaculum TaxID=256616 RepID=UPI0030DCFD3E
MSETHILPDMLRPGLRLVFIGTAASTRSAAVGAYYAHPQNRFWRTLHEVGITPRRFAPQEFRDLTKLGIGFTDVSKIGSGMDHEIAAGDFDAAGLRARLAKAKPQAIAFTSKRAASFYLGKPTGKIAYGRQPDVEGEPVTFVLTSPSGAATRYWSLDPWRELADWFRRAG